MIRLKQCAFMRMRGEISEAVVSVKINQRKVRKTGTWIFIFFFLMQRAAEKLLPSNNKTVMMGPSC